MCGCSSVQVGQSPTFTSNRFNLQQPPADEDCPYTMEQLNAWVTLLVCCKDKAIYNLVGLSAPLLNKYLGIVQSALHYKTFPCYFRTDLDNISTYIILIQGLEQCQI